MTTLFKIIETLNMYYKVFSNRDTQELKRNQEKPRIKSKTVIALQFLENFPVEIKVQFNNLNFYFFVIKK